MLLIPLLCICYWSCLLTLGNVFYIVGSAGKASHGIATMVQGSAIRGAQANATGLAADLARTRIALDERGEKLGRLEDRWAVGKYY